MRNRVLLASIFAILIAAANGASAQNLLTSDIVKKAHDKVTPAICMLEYTTEIKNPNTSQISKRRGSSLGLIVSPEGLIMARGHMSLSNAKPFNIMVTVGTGDDAKEYEATLLNKPDDVNVCFLKMKQNEGESVVFPHVQFEKDAEFELGEPIVVFGILSESLDYSRAMNIRYIGSIIDKPRTTYCLNEPTPFNFVGSPAVNAQGKIVGVLGFDLSSSEGGDLHTRSGYPLVYQSGLYIKYIENPPGESSEEDEEENDAWLGVFTQPLKDDLAEYFGLEKTGGIVISTVMPGSPAEEAGIKRGDVLVSFDGTPITIKQDRDVVDFTKLVMDAGAGKRVNILLNRSGQPFELDMTLGARPKSSRDADEFEDKVFGLTVRELTNDVRIALNVSPEVEGVLVVRVRPGSWADLANIPRGIILSIGGHAVADIGDFRTAVARITQERPKQVIVFCQVGTRTAFYRMEPRWKEDGE